MRIKGTYNKLFVNKDYVNPVIDDWLGYIDLSGTFDGLKEDNYSLGYPSTSVECANVRTYNGDIVDVAFIHKALNSLKSGPITTFDVLYKNDNTVFAYVNMVGSEPGGKAYFLLTNKGKEKIVYILYEDKPTEEINARSDNRTNLYTQKTGNGDRRKDVLFITNTNNDTFNGKYMEYADADDYVLYVTDDGKNIAFDFCKNRGKRQAMIVIKSKELIQRFGKDFIKRDFLSKTFITGNQNHIRFFHEDYGELFEILFQKPNHIEIKFDDGKIIKEDDGQIAIGYLKKKASEIKRKQYTL